MRKLILALALWPAISLYSVATPTITPTPIIWAGDNEGVAKGYMDFLLPDTQNTLQTKLVMSLPDVAKLGERNVEVELRNEFGSRAVYIVIETNEVIYEIPMAAGERRVTNLFMTRDSVIRWKSSGGPVMVIVRW